MYDLYPHCFCSDSIYLSLVYPAHVEPSTLAMRVRSQLSRDAHHFVFYNHDEDEFSILKSLPLNPLIRADKFVRTISVSLGENHNGEPLHKTWNLSIIFAYTKREAYPQGDQDLTPFVSRATEERADLFLVIDGELVFTHHLSQEP